MTFTRTQEEECATFTPEDNQRNIGTLPGTQEKDMTFEDENEKLIDFSREIIKEETKALHRERMLSTGLSNVIQDAEGNTKFITEDNTKRLDSSYDTEESIMVCTEVKKEIESDDDVQNEVVMVNGEMKVRQIEFESPDIPQEGDMTTTGEIKKKKGNIFTRESKTRPKTDWSYTKYNQMLDNYNESTEQIHETDVPPEKEKKSCRRRKSKKRKAPDKEPIHDNMTLLKAGKKTVRVSDATDVKGEIFTKENKKQIKSLDTVKELEIDVTDEPLSDDLVFSKDKNVRSVQMDDFPLAHLTTAVPSDRETQQEQSVVDKDAESDTLRSGQKASHVHSNGYRDSTHRLGNKNNLSLKLSEASCPSATKSTGLKSTGLPLGLFYCPRNCSFTTSDPAAFKRHVCVCNKPEVQIQRLDSSNNSVTHQRGEVQSQYLPRCFVEKVDLQTNPLLTDSLDTGNFNDCPKQRSQTCIGSTDSSLLSRTSCVENSLASKGNKQFICNVCGKEFRISDLFRKHMRTHTHDKPYKCNVCAKQFADKSNLNRHMMIHTGEKPFKCNDCGKLFAHNPNLKRHMRTHTGEKPLKCNVCGKVFAWRPTFDDHISTHTGDKPFKCSVCGKLFARKSPLIQHMVTHAGDKPYKCNICGKQFPRKSTLVRHGILHADDKTFKCYVCQKPFAQKQTLDEHMSTHSGDKP